MQCEESEPGLYWGTNLDFAAQDVRDQIGLYRGFLPEDAADPLTVKFNMSAWPVIFWGVTADMSTSDLKDLVEDEVAMRIERIDGVASAQVFSTDTREILVEVIVVLFLGARVMQLMRVIY